MAQFASLMPQYADQVQAQLNSLSSWLTGLGISQAECPQHAQQHRQQQHRVHRRAGAVQRVRRVHIDIVGAGVGDLLAVDGAVFNERMARYRAGHEPVLGALGAFAKGTRKYFGVATVFGGIVAILDGIALLILGIPAAGLWALLALVTNYVPNVGFVIGLIPPALLGLLIGGPGLMIAVIAVYSVLNFIIQSVLQPKFVGDAVGLTTTMTFVSLIVWAYITGPLGAILAVPASLLVKALLVDVDTTARWLDLFLGDKPVFPGRKSKKPKRRPPCLSTWDEAPTS